MELPKNSSLIPLLLFLLLFLFTYSFASNSTIMSKVGDDKAYLAGSYHLSSFESLSEQQKWDYAYFHIHKPLIIALMMGVHWLHLAAFWWALPYIFYLLGGIFLFLFLKGKVESQIVLFGTVLVLMLNSTYLYFGLHLLPDIPLAASLMAMLYFLDRAVKPDGSFSKNSWHATMACGLLASLFRIETLPVLLLPPLYYSHISKKPLLQDKNIRNYALISAITLALFFLLYLFAIEKTTNFLDYPGIMLAQLSKVQAATNAIGANQGNFLYIIVETALSFTLLPFLLSLAGLYMIVRKKAVAFYPAAFLFIFLLLESTLITFLSHGEQRYTTRLFPLLAISLACFLEYFRKTVLARQEYGKQLLAALLLLLIASSYFMVHQGLLPGQLVIGYRNKMLTVTTPADAGFSLDQAVAADSTYLFIAQAAHAYPSGYSRIFTNANAGQFSEYMRILDNKEVHPISDLDTLGPAREGDIFFLLINSKLGRYQGAYEREFLFPAKMPIKIEGVSPYYSAYVYVMTPAQYYGTGR
jgi:hypothetical protein